MPKNKDLKRRVRARMQKTGESYTTARAQLVGRRTETAAPDYAELAGMSDEAVRTKTGGDWRHWVRELDRLDATALPHREIARHLREELGLPGWWAQTVTVGYERIRGLRDKGQQRGGGYDVNKSRTYPVSVAELYAAFGARARRRWLTDGEFTVKKATRLRSMRLTWDDGLAVNLHFWRKDRAKSQVQLQHRGLPSKAAADRVRAAWTERLAALGDYLRQSSR